MEEEIIIVGQEDNVIKIKEDASSGIKIKENVESITVDSEKPISIGVESAFPPLGEDNADLNHSKLYGRDLPNQHPIYAVEGLREELDAIEELQTVYSDKKQQANYYLWQDENLSQEIRDGYFVCFHQGTDKIQKCNSKTDVFGVTVADAGFVGGQEYIQAPNGKKTGRDSAYGLVATIGTVGVRCESDVAVGDYVAPNADGIAAKSSGNYGYLVTAIEDRNGIDYAIVSLIAPSTLAKSLADGVQDIGKRMSNAEYNITAVGNTASAAYKLAHDTKESTSIDMDVLEEKVKEIIERTDNNEVQVDRIESDLGSLKQSVAQAKAQAQSAINSAEATRQEAVKNANDALIEAKKNGADLEAYKNIVANIDKYTVGEHSQAYGLTLAQAEQVLERGMVYVPTVGFDEEGYKNIEEYSNVYSQSFLRGYYYTWNGISWTPSTAVGVTFSSDGSYITGHENMPYWVIENEDVVHDGITYPKDALYLWQNDKWNQQATISKNVINRTVALVRHTANEVAQEVTNARGSAATLGARLDEDGAKVSLVASVVTELKNVKPVAILNTIDKLPETAESGAYYCVGTSAPYDVYKYDGTEFKKELLIYYDGAHFCKVNTASIVSAVNNEGDSSISLSANKINFSGLSTFFSTDENGGITAINGSGITTGTLDATLIKTGTLDASKAKITNIDASNITTGTMKAGVIQSKEYISGTSGLKLDLDNGTADITGKIVAKEGKIGEITINTDGSINSKNNYFKVGADGTITATSGTIGAWTLDSFRLYRPHETSSDGTDLPGTGMTSTRSSGDPAFYAGYTGNGATPWDDSSWSNNTQFYVTNTGKLVAKEADIKGIINAISGNIGGLMINQNNISSGSNGLTFSTDGLIVANNLQINNDFTANVLKISKISGKNNINSYFDFEGQDIQTEDISVSLSIKTIRDYTQNMITGEVTDPGQVEITITTSKQLTANKIFDLTIGWSHYNYATTPTTVTSITATTVIPIAKGQNTASFTTSKIVRRDGYTYTISSSVTKISPNSFKQQLEVLLSSIKCSGTLSPTDTNTYQLGADNARWSEIWCTQNSINSTSDRNEKNSIEVLSDKYDILFDNLQPVRYKFNKNTSNRYHIGFISQEVEDALKIANIPTSDFAGFIKYEKVDSEDGYGYGLRYGEFIALNTYEIQKLKKHIVELEKEIKALKGEE